jgi:CheY-like chemotaxis protein
VDYYKKLNLSNHLPNIVACTAYVSEDIRKSCFEVGMKEFINKPVSQSEIKKCIARLSVT